MTEILKRTTIALALLLTTSAAVAERFDTAYVGRPKEDLTIKIRLNQSGSRVVVKGKQNDTKFSTDIGSDMKATISVAASYKGIAAGLAINPLKLLGKYNDFELNANTYSNRFGVDAVFARVNSYTGTMSWGGEESEIVSGQVEQRMLTVSGYYVFNHRRFSYPAAFSQSQIQRVSCGSWLLGATLMWGYYAHDATLQHGSEEARLTTRHLGLGCGYGYNFVLRKGGLLHISAVPQIVVWTDDYIKSGSSRKGSMLRFPNFITTGRMAVVHSFGNKFIGLTAVINQNSAGSESDFHVTNVKWRARLFYGFRI